jgi:hypothetical protein
VETNKFLSYKKTEELFEKIRRGLLTPSDLISQEGCDMANVLAIFNKAPGGTPLIAAETLANIYKRLGGGVQGVAYGLHTVPLAIKEAPLKYHHKRIKPNDIKTIKKALGPGNESTIEVKVNILASMLFTESVSPHFLRYTSAFVCPKTASMYNVMETAHGEFSELQKTIPPNTQGHMKLLDHSSIVFQLLHAIYVMQQVFKIKHHDMHSGNIMYVKCGPNDPPYVYNGELLNDKNAFVYNVGRQKYYFPNRGYLLKIMDFGFSGFQVPTSKVREVRTDFPWDSLQSKHREIVPKGMNHHDYVLEVCRTHSLHMDPKKPMSMEEQADFYKKLDSDDETWGLYTPMYDEAYDVLHVLADFNHKYPSRGLGDLLKPFEFGKNRRPCKNYLEIGNQVAKKYGTRTFGPETAIKALFTNPLFDETPTGSIRMMSFKHKHV